MKYESHSEDDTFNYAKSLAGKVEPGDIFLLEGGLGAGKSVFVRGMAKGLGIEEYIPSPTFTLINIYNGKYTVYHFDLYRINDPFELFEIGFEDYIYSKGVSFIEWASKAGELIPDNAVRVNIEIKDGKREIGIDWTR
jgi:tRNA threonylcarbamoyladenosine biosynthesis protein TsaE